MLPKLTRYEVAEEIGVGGMATVYRAHDTHLDRWVALKVLHPHLRSAKEARVRFSREARAAARLKHPQIVEVYDYSGESSETLYLAAELLSGPTLKGWAEQHPGMPAELAACIAYQLAGALGAAHAQGVVHRDVKPENVLIDRQAGIKLTDFGIAQTMDGQSFTATGQILGSPQHMSPEQVEGKECDARSDIFSLGSLLYQLAVGAPPFSGRNPHQVLAKVGEASFADPLRLRPAIGRGMRSIILRAMARQPDDRYADAQAMQTALQQHLLTLGIDDPSRWLRRSLQAPAETFAELHQRVLDQLVAGARQAALQGDQASAMASLDHALALEPHHAPALRLVQSVRQRTQRRRLWSGAAALVLTAAVGAGLFWYPPSAASSGALRLLPREVVRRQRSVPAERLLLRPATPPAVPTVTPPAVSTASSNVRSGAAPRKRSEDGAPSLRTVIFQPQPANVSIGIDGATPLAFGPSFRSATLKPGPHRFFLVGGAGCCQNEEVQVEVPSGEAPFVFKHRLRYRPSGLYVIASVPADVVVAGGLARGRSRYVIWVPLKQAMEEMQAFTVSADGYQPFAGEARLLAGQVTEIRVTLQPLGGTL